MLTQGSARHVAEIQRIVLHEYYNAYTLDYDIALLQLKKAWPASLSPLVQPVCLPGPSHTVTDGHHCWVTGWGSRSEDGEQHFDKTAAVIITSDTTTVYVSYWDAALRVANHRQNR